MKKITIFALFVMILSACSLLPQEDSPSQIMVTETLLASVMPTQTNIPTVETPASTATVTPVVVSATMTVQPAITLEAVDFPYRLQEVSPVYTSNFAHPEAGCAWLGMAGQVFDAQAVPAQGLVMVVEGYLQESAVDAVALTGTSKDYGPGGFEIVLADLPVDSTKALTVSLFDLQGNPLAPRIALDTYADCSKNLILINFQEVN